MCIFCYYSVLGMNLFGGKFCWKADGSTCTCKQSLDPTICECDRANFNSLLWSLVTVFQVPCERTFSSFILLILFLIVHFLNFWNCISHTCIYIFRMKSGIECFRWKCFYSTFVKPSCSLGDKEMPQSYHALSLLDGKFKPIWIISMWNRRNRWNSMY